MVYVVGGFVVVGDECDVFFYDIVDGVVEEWIVGVVEDECVDVCFL